jgi:hypothetical protein
MIYRHSDNEAIDLSDLKFKDGSKQHKPTPGSVRELWILDGGKLYNGNSRGIARSK